MPALAVANNSVYVTGSSDGHYGSEAIFDFATVKYTWRTHLEIHPFTPGSPNVTLTLSGPPSSSWGIERGVLVTGPWTNLGHSLIGANGVALFQDPNPPGKAAFYRATQP